MSENKRIAKNTMFLYFRMILVMGVTLYTSRIVLKELGISDYGIYSLVGGFVALFGFLNAAMSSATQRYLTFDLGKKDNLRLQKTFSAVLTIHIGIALFVLLIAETFGLWYVNNRMIFPPERLITVNIVYQFSIAAALLSVIQVPYNALIIAHERLNIYAYVGIVEVLLKLAIVFMLVYLGDDKLITYSILTFAVALGIRLFYQFYCKKNFKESRYIWYWDKIYYKELVSYSGWNLIGNFASVARSQGNNVILNLFFGTAVNAAYGIMMTVNSAVNSFITNFQVASNPQIIKRYANGEELSMQQLINQTSKYSFFLSLLIITPLFFNINYVLKFWLVNPPNYSAILIRMILVCSLVDSISGPIMMGVTATGKIKIYHIVIGIFNLLNLPISYFLLKYKIVQEPQIVLLVWLFFSIISLFFRLYFLSNVSRFDMKSFLLNVILRLFIVCILSVFMGLWFSQIFSKMDFENFILSTIAITAINVGFIFLFGINKKERKILFQLGYKILKTFN